MDAIEIPGSSSLVVVGGGPAGLACAALAARAGVRDVVVLERAGAVGGRARSTVVGGHVLNLGPHAVYRGGAAERVLSALDVSFPGGRPRASGALVLRGVRHAIPAGPFDFATSALFTGGERLAAMQVLPRLLVTRASRHVGTPVRELLRREIAPEHANLGAFVAALFRVATYTTDEAQCAGLALAALQTATFRGVRYVDGGWQSIVDGLVVRAESAGVRVVCGAQVREVERDERGVCAVRVERHGESTRIATSRVVLCIEPDVASALVPSSASLARAASRAIPVRIATLDVALSRLPCPSSRVAFGLDEPLYYSLHSAVAKLAPAGGAALHVGRYLGTDEPPPDASSLERFLDLAQPGWRECVVHRRFLPSMTAMTAMVRADDGGVRGRPDCAVLDVPGLFVAGDWVGPEGHLLDATLASAETAASRAASAQPRPAAVRREAVGQSASP